MRKIFAEIRRRGLFGTAALYLAGAWVVLQVGTTVFPLVGLPPALAGQVLLMLLLAGLPVALILAWFFDLGRKGITRTPDVETAPVADVPSLEPPPGHSIAVLPFVNMSSHAEHEYFSDGISEELLNTLASLSQLRVAARTSSFAFKGKNTDVRTIARQLGVRNILEGSVRWAARACASRPSSSRRSMAITCGRRPSIASWRTSSPSRARSRCRSPMRSSCVSAAKPHRRLQATPTTSMDAYHCYLRARHLWQRRGEAAIRSAIEQYRKAIALDPLFARAYASLAAAHAVLPEYTGEPRVHGFAVARPLAQKALELDPSLGEVHGVLSYMHFWLWDWSQSEECLQRALALDSQDPQLHQWYSELAERPLRDRTTRSPRRAGPIELDPVSPIVNCVLAVCHTVRGEDEEAMYHLGIARELGAGPLPLGYVELFANLRKREYAAARAPGSAR